MGWYERDALPEEEVIELIYELVPGEEPRRLCGEMGEGQRVVGPRAG